MITTLRLGASLIWRERHATPIKTMFVVLCLATFFLTVVNQLNAHAWQVVTQQATKAFGADLIISSSEPIPEAIYQQANKLKHLEVTSTLTMASSADNFQLVSLKAVSKAYPLMGEAFVDWGQGQRDSVKNNPGPGTVWVEKRLLSQMKVAVGDAITIGEKKLTIAGIILKEPDASTGILLLAPRVIMNMDDLAATQVVAPGSRVQYAIWLVGSPDELAMITEAVEVLDNRNLEVESVVEGRSPLQRVVKYANRYLGLILFLSVVLTGVSISLTTRIWVRKRLTSFAIYRVLGASPKSLIWLLMGGIVFWGVLLIIAMMGLGTVTAALLVAASQAYYPTGPFEWQLWPTILSFGIALFLLCGFSLPEMMLTGKVAPIEILRGKTAKMQSLLGFYLVVISLCLGLLYFYIQNLSLTLILIAGFGWAAFIGYLLLVGIIYLMTKWPSQNLYLKCAVAQLKYRHAEGASQMLCLTLALMILIILSGIQNGFLDQWQASLPEDTPNHFIINIPVEVIEDLQADIQAKTKTKVPVFPMIRGRVKAINDVLVEDMQGPLDNGLRRALNLSYMAELPDYNPIVEGPDWEASLAGQAVISIEAGFASRIGVTVGDQMSFIIAGQTISGTIYNIRDVTWQSFKPNFFIIFPPQVLDELPATAITSFYFPGNDDSLIVELKEKYPEITIFDVDAIIGEVQAILNILITVLEGIIALVTLFALVILYVILTSSKAARKTDASMLKLLGASQGFIQRINLIEFMLLSLVTILMAILGGGWILNELSQRLFDMYFSPPWMTWVIEGSCAFVFLTLFGYITLRDVGKQSPLRILRV